MKGRRFWFALVILTFLVGWLATLVPVSHGSMQIRGSLSANDVEAICKELRHERRSLLYYSLVHCSSLMSLHLAKDCLTLSPVSLEGGGSMAVVEFRAESNECSARYEFTNSAGTWLLRNLSLHEVRSK